MTTLRMLAVRGNPMGLTAAIADALQNLAKALFDPYRPERHYMRGPGPRWHAKHDLHKLPKGDFQKGDFQKRNLAPVVLLAIPALVRVRG